MRKWILIAIMLLPVLSLAQGGKFKEGFIVDRSGVRYDGFIRYEPGTNSKPAQVFFREGKKGKTETYGPNYVRSFKMESDSFAILKKITIPRQKVKEEDFAKVLAVTPTGVFYEYEFEIPKTSEHAASDFTTREESIRYFYESKGKLVLLTPSNFRDVGNLVGDCPSLKAKIAGRKVKYADLLKVIDEYKICRSQSAAAK